MMFVGVTGSITCPRVLVEPVRVWHHSLKVEST